MKNNNLIIVIVFLSSLVLSRTNSRAQPCLSGREYNKWYFGEYAGLDFNTNPPTVLTNSSLVTAEGCASISDAAGNLLMYSDGLQVWNANQEVMPNGSGLLGNSSASQGALIVPAPASNHLYYLFTIDQLAGLDGLRYSVIDMNLDGGMGDIIAASKNILLQTPVTEKLTAVRHCNNRDIWIVAHDWDSNDFLSYLLTDEGIQTPIVSSVGVVHTGGIGGGNGINLNSVGCMKVSPDSKRLACALRNMGLCEVFDFKW